MGHFPLASPLANQRQCGSRPKSKACLEAEGRFASVARKGYGSCSAWQCRARFSFIIRSPAFVVEPSGLHGVAKRTPISQKSGLPLYSVTGYICLRKSDVPAMLCGHKAAVIRYNRTVVLKSCWPRRGTPQSPGRLVSVTTGISQTRPDAS